MKYIEDHTGKDSVDFVYEPTFECILNHENTSLPSSISGSSRGGRRTRGIMTRGSAAATAGATGGTTATAGAPDKKQRTGGQGGGWLNRTVPLVAAVACEQWESARSSAANLASIEPMDAAHAEPLQEGRVDGH